MIWKTAGQASKKNNAKQVNRENRAASLVFSMLFALNLTVGHEVYLHNGIERFLAGGGFLLRKILMTVLGAAVVYFLIERVLVCRLSFQRSVGGNSGASVGGNSGRSVGGSVGRNVDGNSGANVDGNTGKCHFPGRRFFLLWAGIFAAWLPAFFAYYPGILSYDARYQTQIVLGMLPNTRFHPPLHTFLWKICIRLGGRTGLPALSIYGLAQMLLLSMVMAYLLDTITREWNIPVEPESGRERDLSGEPESRRERDLSGEPESERERGLSGEPESERERDLSGEPESERERNLREKPETKQERKPAVRPGRVFLVVSFIFIALNPVMAVMSLTMTKDVSFTMALTVLAVQIFRMEKSPERYFQHAGNWLVFVFSAVAAGLLRNNMLYALVLSFVVMILIRPGYRRKMICLAAVCVAGIMIINGPVYDAMGIAPGSTGEMLSVPMQQIARAAVEHGGIMSAEAAEGSGDAVAVDESGSTLTLEEQAAIGHFLPYDDLAELYNPRFADPVKREFDTEYFNGHRKEFISLWLHLLRKYPVDYVDAFLELNIPYWYIGAKAVDPYSDRQYIETYIYKMDYFPVKRASRAPGLLKYYETFAKYKLFVDYDDAKDGAGAENGAGAKDGTGVKDGAGAEDGMNTAAVFGGIAGLVYSLAVPVWLMLLGMTLILRRESRQGRVPAQFISCFLPFLFLWLTYMAGPVSNFRYIFPMYAVYPLFIFLAVKRGNLSCCEER